MATAIGALTMTMARIHGRDTVSLDQVPVPRIGERDILVRVARCGLCGSDLGYIAAGGVAFPATEPFGIGHELAGTVAAVGDAVRDIPVGLRIFVNPMGDGNAIGAGAPEGAFAPYLLVQRATLGQSVHSIPDHVGWDAAALAEPLSVALHAVRRSGASAADRVAVFGVGPIGLGIVHFLKHAGVGSIVAVDRSAARLARAGRLGADLLVDVGTEDAAAALGRAHGTGDLFGWPTVGTNIFFEVSGAPTVLPAIIGMAPFHALAVLVAVVHEPLPINTKMLLGKEMTLTTSMAYPDEFPEVIAAISAPGFDADAFISHRFTLDRFDEALAAARDTQRSAKVMVVCDA